LAIVVGLATVAFPRTAPGVSEQSKEPGGLAALPAYCLVGHNVGKIELGVNNNGTFGIKYAEGQAVDCFTGEEVASCEYPIGSRISYLYGAAFWIGAVVDRDTLVSLGADGWNSVESEFAPDESPFGDIIYRSIRDPNAPEYDGAISEQDYIATYSDTLLVGLITDVAGKPHQPLDIEITQATYAWSYAYAEDFVLFDYKITNIGTSNLQDVYMGIYVDADVAFEGRTSDGAQDDICGFMETYPAEYGNCTFLDTVFAAFIADNDGDFSYLPAGSDTKQPCPNVTATRIVRTPAESLDVSFNWWIGNTSAALDFGPREKANVGRLAEPFRTFRHGNLGTPVGDEEKYYVMRNREFDYDQVYTASIQVNDTLWLYPNQDLADDFADGYDTRYLISFGPFDINPGQTLPLSFAYVGGEDLHQDENNALNNLPYNPDAFYANLDFSDLALNSRWASWVYDNPGVDTDGDSFSGKWHECCNTVTINGQEETVCDTFWYEGDGIPDFRGASPPPAPEFWVERDDVGSLRIRWNGFYSETTRDVFSREMDFEGYRVYLARDERAASFSMMQSYDHEDYNKLVYVAAGSDPGFELKETPFTIEQLRCLYGSSCNDTEFDPLDYTRSHPYVHPDYPESVFIFEPQDYNASILGVNTGIHKIYPFQDEPNLDSINAADTTDDGYYKYYEYEYVLDDLLPTVQYYVNVTAFDYGSPATGLGSLETSVSNNAQLVYPIASWDNVQNQNLEVYVYPNPYRIDAGYRDRGYEGRVDTDRPPDRTREIHFANLPPKCTIRIFTLDGDMVREIEHDEVAGSGADTHESWNMITRNTQMVVSGIYYWTVDAPGRDTQIGKLVVIM